MRSILYRDISKEHDICAIGADTLDDLKFPIALDGIAYYISNDTQTILYRQELFKNILAFPEIYELFAGIYDSLVDLKEISLKNPESLALDNEQRLYTFGNCECLRSQNADSHGCYHCFRTVFRNIYKNACCCLFIIYIFIVINRLA